MKRALSILWLFLSVPIYGQQYSPENRFLKEELTQRWEGGEYINFKKSVRGYNPQGRLISQIRYAFENSSNQWRVSSNYNATYDNNGNLKYLLRQTWDWESQRLQFERETRNRYQDSLLIESVEFSSDYEGNRGEFRLNYEFIDNGLLKSSQRLSIYNGEKSGYRSRHYWSGVSCPNAMASDYLSNDIWVKSDSTIYNNCDFHRSVTQYSFNSGYPEIVFMSKAEIDKLSNGQEITYFYSKESTDEDWGLTSIQSELKDPLNNYLVEYAFVWISDSIMYRVQIDRRKDVEELYTEIGGLYSWPDSIRIETYTSIYDFDSVENKRIYESEVYNHVTDKLESKQHQYHFYDENGFLIETRIYNKYDQFEFESNETRVNDCDGAVIRADVVYQETGNIENRFSSTYSYFQNAPCSEIEQPIDISVFPNPTNTYLKIFSLAQIGNAYINVVGADGRTHMNYQEEVSNYFFIDTSALKNGVYILRVDNGKFQGSSQFVVSR